MSFGIINSQKPGSTLGVTSCCSRCAMSREYKLQLLLAGDVEVNPGPGGSSFPCGLCEIEANWSNGGIACEHCDVWYHRNCARLNLSSFNRLASPSRIWICYKCSSKNFSHFPFHYSQLYLTVSNSFDPLSDTNFTFEIDSFSSTTPFVSRIHSTPNFKRPNHFRTAGPKYDQYIYPDQSTPCF